MKAPFILSLILISVCVVDSTFTVENGRSGSSPGVFDSLVGSVKEAYDHRSGGGSGERERTPPLQEMVQESARWELKCEWKEGEGGLGLSSDCERTENGEDENDDESDEVELSVEGYRREEFRLEQRLASMYSGHHLKDSMERAEGGGEKRRRRKLVEDGVYGQKLKGDVYYSKLAFKRTYRDMEKNMKVFVYSEGQPPLTHYGTLTDSYSMDALFMHYLKPELSQFVTEDAASANLFFIPINFVSLVTYLWEPSKTPTNKINSKPMKSYVAAYTDMIDRTHPYFRANQGRDHFIVSCHDWAPLMSRGHRAIHKHTMRVMCNANVSYDFASARDVPLPAINIPKGEYPTEFGGPPPSERPLLVFYAGTRDGKIRGRIHELWKGYGNGFRIFNNFTGDKSGMTYRDHLRSSKYCLCPGGVQVNTARIVEAIYNDCVPVIASDGLVLPFSDVLNWAKFSVIIYYSQIPQLNKILKDIPRDKYLKMQARLSNVRKHFIINNPPRRYDVFHMVLHSLWLRQLQMKDKSGPIFSMEES